MSNIDRIHKLVAQLNIYRDEYYNQSAPSVSDAVYDRLFDELSVLEKETGCIMSNSPTQTVGYKVVSELGKVAHRTPLLSLDKTKQVNELNRFIGDQVVMLMLKLDGLTIKLEYEEGKLKQASTRGDGNEGEDITHSVPTFRNVPLSIDLKDQLVITGEAYIHNNDFEPFAGEYKNARNLAAGSVRCLDPNVCAGRGVCFVAFNVLEGFPDINSKNEQLERLSALGFDVCDRVVLAESVTTEIDDLKAIAKAKDIPIDGIVATYDDIEYSKAQGRTGHHYKDGLAFKFEDEMYETRLVDVEWGLSRMGTLTPVAIFDSVEIDGTDVSRASLHNVTFIRELDLGIGNRVLVTKRNMIIPHIEENLDRGQGGIDIPDKCPCCGEATSINVTKDKVRKIEVLYCTNAKCATKRIKQFTHFVSKGAANIDGLSEATLEKLIEKGFLQTFIDIYYLNRYKDEIIAMEGLGERSYENLWASIEKSRRMAFDRFLVAIEIPMIGKVAGREISRHFDVDDFEDAVAGGYDFSALNDFGGIMNENIHNWFADPDNAALWQGLRKEITFTEEKAALQESPFLKKTVVVTGTLQSFTRSEISEVLLSFGAIPMGSISKKTDYLLAGEKAGSKLAKAESLGVKIITEEEFVSLSRQ